MNDIDINMEIQFGERVGHGGFETCEYKSLKFSHILYKKKNRTEQSRALPQHKLNSRASASSSQAQAHVHVALSAREKYNLLSFCSSTLLPTPQWVHSCQFTLCYQLETNLAHSTRQIHMDWKS